MSDPVLLIATKSAARFRDALGASLAGFDVRLAEDEETAIREGAEAEIMVAPPGQVSGRLIEAMPKLKWIQSLSAGVEGILGIEALPEDLPVTTLSGAHGPQMSELILWMAIGLLRDMPAFARNQAEGKWEQRPVPPLVGRTMCIYGLGSIAEALIARAAPFGLRITGISDGRSEMEGVDRIWTRDGLSEAAADADFLVVLSPLTEATKGSVNADVLTALGSKGYLINLGRGPVVDEAALIEALRAGTIAGAGLDVFETEPLPEASPLWGMKNVIVTPHVGGMSDIYAEQAAEIVGPNLEAWVLGGAEALKNRAR
ncbi:D-2-hydroxyacid dehydrogenase [Tropicimonas sp. IMCC34011]|uniref:D-2-hydroxyacid dehydrogenase n=1 Tax=Tropicimonas sp. IMCC34011 TaxID=2248759 RepID=UPI000E257E9B|nr:D-2-hydroxyacid dehydrogenase [Tropicimonas sp. IMCC34011]